MLALNDDDDALDDDMFDHVGRMIYPDPSYPEAEVPYLPQQGKVLNTPTPLPQAVLNCCSDRVATASLQSGGFSRSYFSLLLNSGFLLVQPPCKSDFSSQS